MAEGQFEDAEDESNVEFKDDLVNNVKDPTVINVDTTAEKVVTYDTFDYEEYSGDEYDDDYADGIDVGQNKGVNPNQQAASTKLTNFQPSEKVLKKFSEKIHVGMYDNKVKEEGRVRDKADRATVEQVMDPRTRMILFKLLNRGFISEISGCISTGKEANVYYATGGVESEQDLAIKIYKT